MSVQGASPLGPLGSRAVISDSRLNYVTCYIYTLASANLVVYQCDTCRNRKVGDAIPLLCLVPLDQLVGANRTLDPVR